MSAPKTDSRRPRTTNSRARRAPRPPPRPARPRSRPRDTRTSARNLVLVPRPRPRASSTSSCLVHALVPRPRPCASSTSSCRALGLAWQSRPGERRIYMLNMLARARAGRQVMSASVGQVTVHRRYSECASPTRHTLGLSHANLAAVGWVLQYSEGTQGDPLVSRPPSFLLGVVLKGNVGVIARHL